MTTRRFQALTASLIAAGALALTGTGAAATEDTVASRSFEATCTVFRGEVIPVDKLMRDYIYRIHTNRPRDVVDSYGFGCRFVDEPVTRAGFGGFCNAQGHNTRIYLYETAGVTDPPLTLLCATTVPSTS